MTISARDKRGRQAPCTDEEHALYGRNARGQCITCQREAKRRYESGETYGGDVSIFLEWRKVSKSLSDMLRFRWDR